MGVSLTLKNLDKIFHSAKHRTYVVNDISIALAAEKEDFNNKIITRYTNDDLLSNLASCENGCTVGEHHKGEICQECHTPVVDSTDRELQPIVWMRAPHGVRSLINPIFWNMISDFFARGNFDVLRYIADPNYHPVLRTPGVMDAVKSVIPHRGYNYFLENFQQIIEKLMELKVYRTPQKRKLAAELIDLMRTYPDDEAGHSYLFPQYLPFPNKSLLVIEKNNTGTYTDTTVPGAVDAIRTMTGIDLPEMNFTVRLKENRTIKSICQMDEFLIDWDSKSLAGKPGVLRKHTYGTRSDFCFRAVISSISDAHDYDGIYVSWGIAVSVLEIHIAAKLFMMGWTSNRIKGFLAEYALKYNELLARLMDELIEECPYKGIPVILGRNPSLCRGSTQQLFITKIQHDVRVPTICLSVLVLRSLNADFDGDNVNVSLALDHRTARDQRALAPHMSTFDLDEPRHISPSLSLPKPVVSSIAEWMHGEEGPLTPEQERQMAAIPDA
ncbi:MAG: hypothetical protein P4L77_10990 [Sulfuriferula sp.]|nr:hypothetical protein [Sulfuriferula sp.]